MSKNKEQLFKTDVSYRSYRILHLAKKYGWVLEKNNGEMCQFKNKSGELLYVNYFHLHFTTALEHPKWGKTVLKRKGDLTQKLIESIFRNPRAHMPNIIKSEYQDRIVNISH